MIELGTELDVKNNKTIYTFPFKSYAKLLRCFVATAHRILNKHFICFISSKCNLNC